MLIKTIIQARTGSTRLKAKVLRPVLGKPLLQHMIERLSYSKYANDIVIATTKNKADDAIVKLSKDLRLPVYRGDEHDVLDRYYRAAKKYKADIIVRLTSDCPLIDPRVTDRVIKYYLENVDKYDFVSNMHPPTFPDGLDTEVFPFSTLEKAWRESKKLYEREHVTPYIWDNPDIFRIGNVYNDKNLYYVERWTLDYEEDYLFIKEIFEHLYSKDKVFYMEDIHRLLSEKPELININKKYIGTSWWLNNLESLKTKEQIMRTKG